MFDTPPEPKLEGLEGFVDIDVIARVHDTSICRKGSNPSKRRGCRWCLMASSLAGEPLPAPPAVLGRVHRMPEPSTVEADAEAIAAKVWRELAADALDPGGVSLTLEGVETGNHPVPHLDNKSAV